MIRTQLSVVVLCAAILTAANGLGGPLDWPQWRGPDRTDVSRETGLLKSWPDGGPERVWLFENCGIGYSGPAIVGDQLFVLGAREDAEQLIALDAATGQERWATKISEVLKNNYGDGPRGTPTVDGDRVYALSGAGTLACASTRDGTLLWSKTMAELGGEVPGWGYTESVLVDGQRVVCTPGGDQGALAALDKMTGELLWQSKDFTEPAQYASIVVTEHAGKRQYIQLVQSSLVGIDAENGNLLWHTDWPGRVAVIPTPVVHDGYVYVTSGYGAGCKLVKIEPDLSLTEVYTNKEMKNHHGGVILVDGHIYGHSDGVGWICQNFLTGERVWNERSELHKGAIAFADGMLYCLSEDTGEVALIEASTEGWKEHGRFTLAPQTKLRSPQGRIWTHPTIANGRLYLRDQDLLFCFDVSAKE